MQNILKKNWFWSLAVIFYFFTRLVNLKIIPIFTDEAIYSRWAQIALHDPANRFLSLEDWKQPLFIWLAAISQKFIQDPLIATRLVSVFAGLGSLIGIYLLSKKLFDQKVAKIAVVLYILLPFTLLYDRMALFDSLLTMLGIYAVYFSVVLVEKPKLDTAILNGFAIGLAMITKSSGSFFLYLLPLSLLLTKFKGGQFKKTLVNWLPFSIITVAICQVIYNSLRLSPLFYMISRKNMEFIRSPSEVLSDPFLHLFSNFSALLGWLTSYTGILLFVIFLIGIILGYVKKNLKIVYLSLLIFVPFFVTALFNQVIYPRFMLFYFPFLIIVISYAIAQMTSIVKNYSKYLIMLILVSLILPTFSSFKLLTDPHSAKIAESDSGQYTNSWPAGYGVKETVEFLKAEARDKKVYVATEGTFGLLPFALQIYFYVQKNINIEGFWPVDASNLPAQVLEAATNRKTYFVFNENQKEINSPYLKFIAKYQKGRGETYLRLYQV